MQKFRCRWFSEKSYWDQHLSGVKEADRSERRGELKAISMKSSASSKNCGPGWPERGTLGNTSSACVRAQSCPTLCNPEDCSPPGSSVHGISQVRILEWVAIPLSRGSSQPRDRTWVSWISCLGRWVLYHGTIWKALTPAISTAFSHHPDASVVSLRDSLLALCFYPLLPLLPTWVFFVLFCFVLQLHWSVIMYHKVHSNQWFLVNLPSYTTITLIHF